VAAPSVLRSARFLAIKPVRKPLIGFGQLGLFIALTIWYLPLTVRRYSRQTLQAMNSLAWGRGSIIVDGGTISVLVILGVAVGASIAIEGLAVLNLIGFGSLAGIIGGVGTVREIGPLVGGIAYTAQAGCRMTAEIGAMRISDEIDAVDAMGLRPIPFVVGTRLIGGLTVVIPGYLLTLVAAFCSQSLVIKNFHSEPSGTYDHYKNMFITNTDLAYSVLKMSIFCVAITLIHCYYGYFTSGGPVGLGRASGRAVRASLVTIMLLDFVTSVFFWGFQPHYIFKG
jgi:phospholipid/cholesterol/gamma-HCH transport system permease protein